MSHKLADFTQVVCLPKGAKLLICAMDNLGDLVFTSSIFHVLNLRRPDLRVSVLCKNYTKQIAELLPGEPKVFASDPFWDRAPLRSKGSFWQVVKTFRDLKREKFDAAIVASHSWQLAVANRLIGVPLRLGFLHKRSHLGLNVGLSAMNGDLPVVGELLKVLAPLGIDTDAEDARYRLMRDPLDKYYQDCKTTPKASYVCLHPFAGSPKRCADLGIWMKFADYLKSTGENIIWVGATQELDRLESLKDMAPKLEERSDYYVGSTIKAMSALISKAKAYVGHDSGPLHIAAGLRVPVLGLYLAGLSPRTLPTGLGLAETIRLDSPRDLDLETWCNAWESLKKAIV